MDFNCLARISSYLTHNGHLQNLFQLNHNATLLHHMELNGKNQNCDSLKLFSNQNSRIGYGSETKNENNGPNWLTRALFLSIL